MSHAHLTSARRAAVATFALLLGTGALAPMAFAAAPRGVAYDYLQLPVDVIDSQLTTAGSMQCPTTTLCLGVGSYMAGAASTDYITGYVMEATGPKSSLTYGIRSINSPWGLESNYLNAIACSTATSCVAVGNAMDDQVPTQYNHPAAAKWNGTLWTKELPIALPPGAASDQQLNATLYSVSCVPGGDCFAVGRYGTSNGTAAYVAQYHNGTWSNVDIQGLDAAYNFDELDSVSCVSSTRCVAVGKEAIGGTPTVDPLSVAFDGTTWKVLPMSLTASGFAAPRTLTYVTCWDQSHCSVGLQSLYGSYEVELAGDSWGLPQPLPDGLTLTGITCRSTDFCMASGSTSTATVLVERDGESWMTPRIVNPLSTTTAVSSVACTDSGDCRFFGAIDSQGSTFGPISGYVGAEPGAPTALHVAASGTSASLSWVAPAITGSAPVMYWVDLRRASSPFTDKTIATTNTTASFSGLDPHVAYAVRVTAEGDDSSTGPSTPWSAFMIPHAPSVPVGLTASVGHHSVSLTWHAPADLGSPASVHYVVVLSSPGTSAITRTVATRSLSITGLSAGRRYTVSVRAVNATGSSPAAATSFVARA